MEKAEARVYPLRLNPILKPMVMPIFLTGLWVLITKRSVKLAIQAEIANAKRFLI